MERIEVGQATAERSFRFHVTSPLSISCRYYMIQFVLIARREAFGNRKQRASPSIPVVKTPLKPYRRPRPRPAFFLLDDSLAAGNSPR